MKETTAAAPYREANRRTLQLAIWMVVWLLTLAVAQFGPELWHSPAISWIAVIVNLAAGVGLIVAVTRYLRAIDDLERKMLLDALAVTLGVGAVGGFSWVVADAAGLIAVELSFGVLSIVLAVVFTVAIVVGRIRYR